jgi:hypothetical protein
MANQIPRADDVNFGGLQMEEHALFLSLLLQDQKLRRSAELLHQLWMETNARGADVTRPLDELLAFKQMVLARQRAGEWLGWSLPSFTQHILMEGLYFRSRLTPSGTTAASDFQTWLEVVKGHALIGPKLVDPGADRAASASSVAATLAMLQGRCAGGPSHSCLRDADAQIQQAQAWVRGVPPGTSIIPPTLAAHILRENDRASQTMRLLGAGHPAGMLRVGG